MGVHDEMAFEDFKAGGKDAEIASLTAMRDNRVKALALADADIARLRAASEAQRKTIGQLEDVSVQWMNETKRLRAELDAAKAEVLGHEKGIAALGAVIDGLRAALAKEREAFDEAIQLIHREPRSSDWPRVAKLVNEYHARRAAEAKGETK